MMVLCKDWDYTDPLDTGFIFVQLQWIQNPTKVLTASAAVYRLLQKGLKKQKTH